MDTLSSGDIVWPADGVRLRTGVVFQRPLLMPWLTVSENMPFATRFAAQRGGFDRDYPAELTTRFGLKALADRYPDQLSGGQAQRVAVLRAVAAQRDCCCWTNRSARWTRRPAQTCKAGWASWRPRST